MDRAGAQGARNADFQDHPVDGDVAAIARIGGDQLQDAFFAGGGIAEGQAIAARQAAGQGFREAGVHQDRGIGRQADGAVIGRRVAVHLQGAAVQLNGAAAQGRVVGHRQGAAGVD